MYKFNGIIIVLLTVFLLAGCSLAGCSASIVQTEEPITLTYSNIVNTAAGHNEYKTIEMQPEDIHKGDLILINSQYAYNFDDNQDLVSVYDYKNSAYKVSGINVMLNKNAVTAFNNMMKDFQAAKSDDSVIVLDGYRTYEYQYSVFENRAAQSGEEEAAKWVAKAGHSEHHSGLALDLGLYFEDGTSGEFSGTGIYSWIHKNCAQYGFILRYPTGKESLTGISYEPWHFRYIGIPHAAIMNEKKFCFEEYIEYIRNYRFGEEHLAVTVSGREYEIYFAGGTSIKIPADNDYEISGNNADGFIVTVKK